MGSIRRADADDVAALTRLINTAYEVERFFKIGDRTNADTVRALLAKGAFLVTTNREGEIVGCVYVEIRPNERGYFGMLAIAPGLQGQGLGRQLIEAAETHCRADGCRALDLRVVNLRVELPPFYRKLGYEETGTEPIDGDERAGRATTW
jgi:ribosomal protein S18 acetylase RimI-like enzyme